LDYGSPIYDLAPPPKSRLSILDSVPNAAIRICTGVFRSSPTLSLCAESRYYPLHYRRLYLSTSLVTSVLQLPNTSIHDILFNTFCHRLTYRKSFTHTRYYLNHSLSKNTHFHCLLPIISALPPWIISPPNTILKLCEFSKKTTNASVYRTHFLKILNSFPDATLRFTDGSKIENRTGFAYSINNKTFSYRHIDFIC